MPRPKRVRRRKRRQEPSLQNCIRVHWKGLLIVFIPIIFTIGMLIDDTNDNRCFYLIMAMLACWVSEAIPIPITAMIPVVAMPLLNILKSDVACSMYFKSTMVDFVISLIISQAAEYTELHDRVAVHIFRFTETDPKKIHLFVMISSSFLSMILPNSLAVAMLQPFLNGILGSLVELGMCKIYVDDSIPRRLKKPTQIAECFHLSLAFCTTIAGTGLIFGSPANVLLKGIYDKRFINGPDLMDFYHFAAFSFLPTVIFEVFIIWFMRHVYFRDKAQAGIKLDEEDIRAANEVNTQKYNTMGNASFAQYLVSGLFLLMGLMILTRDPILFQGWAKALSPNKEILDASVVALIAYLIFALPADFSFLNCSDEESTRTTPGLLYWQTIMSKVPWDVIFTIGCSGALSEGARISGLAKSIGDVMDDWCVLPLPISLFLVLLATTILTNVIIGWGCIIVLAPAIIELGSACRVNPMYFVMPANLALNWAFMLPAATASNALTRSIVHVPTTDMMKIGFIPTCVGVLIAYIFGLCWGYVVFSDVTCLPDWVMNNASKPDWGESGQAE